MLQEAIPSIRRMILHPAICCRWFAPMAPGSMNGFIFFTKRSTLRTVVTALTTLHEYTWYLDGSSNPTNRVKSETITLPTVSTGHNGSNTTQQTKTFFDELSRPVWSKNADGFITYTEYDTTTGAVVKRITDVDTSQTGDFQNPPSGWQTPAGGGLHLTTEMEADSQGRTTKTTDPNGNITYIVYNDADHEVRTYPGWTGSTTTGPITVRHDRLVASDGTIYSETLTSSANPSVDLSGKPDGQETIDSSNIVSLSRWRTNDAGQVVESDKYFNLAGVSYSTSTYHLGSSSNDSSSGNYHATLTDYDGHGRLKKTVSPAGTITRTIYDARGNVLSTWVGTDDTPTSGYQGGRIDTVTGRVYFRNREEDVDLMRWIQADPSRYINGMNYYAYEGDNPASESDPLGLEEIASGSSAGISIPGSSGGGGNGDGSMTIATPGLHPQPGLRCSGETTLPT